MELNGKEKEMDEIEYNPLINTDHLKSIEIFHSLLHGYGVKATNKILSGDIVYYEKPFCFLQTLPNRQQNLTCGYCNQFIGSIHLELQYLQGFITRQELLNGYHHSEDDDFHPLDILSNGHILSCKQGCGEFYCSLSCRDQHWLKKGHHFLCTGCISEENASNHPLIAFKTHAVQTNEIFLLIADLFAMFCVQYDDLISTGRKSIEEGQAYLESMLSSYVAPAWWDAALPPPGSRPKTFQKTLKTLVKDSYSMLIDVLPIKKLGLENVLSEDFMARCIGMFERNNVGVRLRNPAATLLASLKPGDERTPIMAQALQNIAAKLDMEEACMDGCEDDDGEEGDWEDMDEEAAEISDDVEVEQEGDLLGNQIEDNSNVHTGDPSLDQAHQLVEQYGEEALLPPLDGTAFYLLTCKINHSCVPNVMVYYTTLPGRGLVAQLTALREIEVGEELVQSYVDAQQPLAKRSRELAEYGFTCTCAKCQAESASA